MHDALEAIAEAVNSLPAVYAADFSTLPTAVSVANQCHPLIQACVDHWGWGLHVPCPL